MEFDAEDYRECVSVARRTAGLFSFFTPYHGLTPEATHCRALPALGMGVQKEAEQIRGKGNAAPGALVMLHYLSKEQ